MRPTHHSTTPIKNKTYCEYNRECHFFNQITIYLSQYINRTEKITCILRVRSVTKIMFNKKRKKWKKDV